MDNQNISDNESWQRALKNKKLVEAFDVKPGGKPLPVRQVFKTEEDNGILKKIKILEDKIKSLEKDIRVLLKDNMIFKRKLKNISDRNINEARNNEE